MRHRRLIFGLLLFSFLIHGVTGQPLANRGLSPSIAPPSNTSADTGQTASDRFYGMTVRAVPDSQVNKTPTDKIMEQLSIFSMIRGTVYIGSEPGGATIDVYNARTGKHLQQYRSDEQTGRFTLSLDNYRDYILVCRKDGCLFEARKIVGFTPAQYTIDFQLTKLRQKRETVLKKTLFFREGTDHLSPMSKIQFQQILDLLQSYPQLKVSTKLYVDTRSKNPLTGVVSENRIKTFEEYFQDHKIDESQVRLQTILVRQKELTMENTTHYIRMTVRRNRQKLLTASAVPTENMFSHKNALPTVVGQRSVLSRIHFDFRKYHLRPSSRPTLQKVYQYLTQHPDYVAEVSAHTDSVGREDYNQWLSQRRAESIVDTLVQWGIPRYRIVPKGYGERQPLASNKTPQGRQKNRRAELKLLQIIQEDKLDSMSQYSYTQMIQKYGSRTFENLTFKVQLGAYSLPIKLARFDTLFPAYNIVEEYSYEDGLYKYMVGAFYRLKEVEQLRKKAEKAGFSDAWVPVYYNHMRVEEPLKYVIERQTEGFISRSH